MQSRGECKVGERRRQGFILEQFQYRPATRCFTLVFNILQSPQKQATNAGAQHCLPHWLQQLELNRVVYSFCDEVLTRIIEL